MARKNILEQAKEMTTNAPYWMVAWYEEGMASWTCEFENNGQPHTERTARFRAEELWTQYVEVRVMECRLVVRWGPEDPGGGFNSLEVQAQRRRQGF